MEAVADAPVLNGIIRSDDFLFEHTASIDKLAKALSGFQAKCPRIDKDKENPFLKAKYADLGSILQVANPILGEFGLATPQIPVGSDGDLITMLCHESGQWIRSKYRMKPAKQDPQSVGSSITYQKRYALVALLGLVIDDEDDDGEAASRKEAKPEDIERAKIGKLLRTYKQVEYSAILSENGTSMEAIKTMGLTDLKKVYKALGGDDRMNAIQNRK